MRDSYADLAEFLPVSANDWTVEDWSELLEGMYAVARKIAERHYKPLPIVECLNCGAKEFGRGPFKPSYVERQINEFKKAHHNCQPSIDGGGI